MALYDGGELTYDLHDVSPKKALQCTVVYLLAMYITSLAILVGMFKQYEDTANWMVGY